MRNLSVFFCSLGICTAAFAYPTTFINTAKIIEFFETQPNLVWQDFNFNDTPVIVHNGTPQLLAFNLYPEGGNWSQITDLAYPAWVTEEDPLGIHQIGFHPSYPIDNQTAYVYGFDPNNALPDRAYQAFVHEKFHDFQVKNFENIYVLDLHYQDHFNVEIQYLLFLENKALADLLTDLSSVEKMKDVIAVYKTRRPLMHAPSRAWEDWQMRMEGIAEYVDVDTFLKLPILERSPLEMLSIYTNRNFGWDEERPVDVVDSSLKWRYYSVGAISALALDALKVPYWKEQVEDFATPMDLLSAQFNMHATEIKKRFNLVSNKWHDPLQVQKIHNEIQLYIDTIAAIEKEYQDTEGTEIAWKIKFSCSSGANMEDSYYLANGDTISLGIDMHRICAQANEHYDLRMNQHPIVFASGEGERYKISGTILIDGKPYTEQPESGEAQQLSILSPTVELSYTGHACYQREDNRLTVFECL